MEPPMTPKPMPASLPNLLTNHTGNMFRIVYITLTGVIDTIIPAASLRSWVGKSFSYLFKLAPLLWWALPAKNLAQVIPETNRPAAQDWILDTILIIHEALRRCLSNILNAKALPYFTLGAAAAPCSNPQHQ
ncbi:hypothetical protein DSO57_1002791 [Entomophthora muscae]|uniref:Uncharacterized protein n=1 Tax=Entomophthora muscae TaxID=34485 RepID=A0ACC2RNP1_9FUNG|nr:hypothetical protein DSO57_1002791 [Entomophthora muscae]